MKILIGVLIFGTCGLLCEVGGSDDEDHIWVYAGDSGSEHWGDMFPGCDEEDNKRQSPINIAKTQTKFNELLDDINLVYNEGTEEQYLVNNGHTVKVEEGGEIYVTGGKLKDVFKVNSFHFHWGSIDSQGSEHRIDQMKFPLEMHIVTYDTEKYSSITEAIGQEDSLAVLGVLFEISDKDNPHLESIIQNLQQVQIPDVTNRVLIPYVKLDELLPPLTNHYYRYRGSLTTPGCQQSVVWTVFKAKQKVSESQLEQFRSLLASEEEEDFLVDNWRPIQDLNKRWILRSFPMEGDVIRGGATSHTSLNTLRVFTFAAIIGLLRIY